MNFNVNRLSQLAGISGGKGSLNEASNRSHHDGDVEPAETEHRYGKNNLSEESPKGRARKARDWDGDGAVDETEDDVMLEIDEEEIKKEVLRLRKERLNEDKLRTAIRHEIKDIFATLQDVRQSGSDSSWMYGSDQPRNSKHGRVATPGRAIPGIGFKNYR